MLIVDVPEAKGARSRSPDTHWESVPEIDT